MIVKNEAHVITRAFDSVINMISAIYVCDTGSEDDTVQIIRDYIKEHKLKGKVVSRPWVDFSHNRNESFALAKGKCDYILNLDADEVLVPLEDGVPQLDKKIEAIPEFTADRVDVITHFGNNTYTRPQFVKESRGWKWEKPMHEYCTTSDGKYCTEEVLEGICNYPRDEGARSLLPRKTFRDAIVLENYLIEHPEDSRCWFYLGQSYGDEMENYDRSIRAYEKGMALSNWDAEKYVAHLRIGRMNKYMDRTAKSLEHFRKAYDSDPSRPEALYELMVHYRANDAPHMAALYGEKAFELSKNSYAPRSLFIEKDIYRWKILDELSLSYYYSGNMKKCLKLVPLLLKAVPEHNLERINKNIDGFRKGLPGAL